MPVAAVALALGAAFLHALWNLLAARARDPQATMAVALVAGCAALLPVAVVRWRVDVGAVPYVALSAALEFVYLVLLAAAYRRAELSLIYPIARGLAPVLVLVAGAIALGQTVGLVAVAGILLVGVGIGLVRGVRTPADARHVGLAIVIATLIAGYTLTDQQGLRFADPVPYLLLVVGLPSIAFLGLVAADGGAARIRAASRPSTVVAGISGVAAYGLVLAALTMAPAALVAAVRESSVVIATGMAVLVLDERVGPARWLGSVVVVVGVALVVAG
jgi:drug/metabolite transporter (DMT)-like permease